MPDDLGQPRLGKHGGPRTKGQRNPDTMPTGVRRDYILARLERDGRRDLAEAIREGRASAYSIACELGWTKRAEPTGFGSGNAAKRRQYQLRKLPGLPGVGDGLSVGQLMELWLGPGPSGSLFHSREQLVQAWQTHQDEIMRRFGRSGRRPAAFYEFVWDGPRPSYYTEKSVLWRAGVLSEEERIEVETEWAMEFERTFKPDFFFHDGREVLHGVAARRAHYRWADIPDELIEAWEREGRRPKRQPVAPPEEAALTVRRRHFDPPDFGHHGDHSKYR